MSSRITLGLQQLQKLMQHEIVVMGSTTIQLQDCNFAAIEETVAKAKNFRVQQMSAMDTPDMVTEQDTTSGEDYDDAE